MENKHPEIPPGVYCYGVGPIDPQTGHPTLKRCPYWKDKLINGWPGAHCEFLKEDSEHSSITSLIWDEVKECGQNMEWDEEK